MIARTIYKLTNDFLAMRQHNRTQTKPPKRVSEENLSKIQTQLDNRLSRYAQLQYFNFLYQRWKQEKEKVPPTEAALVPSHYFFADAFKIALHWRLYYKPNKEYEALFGVPETALARIVEWSRSLVL